MRTVKNVLAGAALTFYLTAPAYAIGPLPNQPLFLSSAVSPNVMLLVDNSGSMANIIQPAGVLLSNFPAVAYRNGSDDYVFAPLSDGNISISAVRRDGCGSGYKALWSVVNGSLATKRCYRFPDPVGDGATRYTGKYLAYIFNTFTAANNDLLAQPDSAVPKSFRMQVARDSAKGIVQANRSMRIGLSTFNAPRTGNSGPGGSITQEVKSLSPVSGVTQTQADQNYTSLISGIDALEPEANTPLAESYYEVTRYFRGLERYQGSGSGSYTSPIQYRCQKNFGIVVTDGLPTHDRSFPDDDPDRDNPNVAGDNNLPNWDGLQPAVGQAYSDGNAPDDSSRNGEGDTLFLDDIAKFAFDIDLKQTGTDQAGKSFNDKAFLKQNMLTYTVGFALDNQMLLDAAGYGKGVYYTASDSASLSSALNAALQSIRDQTSSASAITANSTRIQEDSLIYQSRFNSADWTGEVRAFRVNEDGSVGSQVWSTNEAGKIPAASGRNIFTFNGSAGTSFLWSNLTPEQKTSLYKAADDTEANAMLRLDWLRGGNDGVALGAPYASSKLRSRNAALGDIINSDPRFVGEQNNGYNVPNTDATGEPADSYFDYLTAKASKTPLLIVGANDGMVHAFNGDTGTEVFAYVPSTVFKKRTATLGATPGLLALTEPEYDHQFYADGAFGLGDVYNNSSWKTYLVGGLGAGGRGVFALNVTARNAFGSAGVLWERTAPDINTTSGADADWNDLGYIFGEPTIARVKTSNNDAGTWVAIFGNGYASNSGKAALYIVNATSGTLLKKIVVNDPATATLVNGLSTVTAFLDSNRFVTHVYGGDLQGNLWKFDLGASNTNSWDAKPLFQAKKGTVRQPITSKVRAVIHPNGGRLVTFGTGKYLEATDKINTAVQSLYGIWDRGLSNDGTVAQASLVEQTITSEVASNGRQFRTVSQNTVDWSSKFGWYMDLRPNSSTAVGERVISMPLVTNSRVLYSTFTPLSDPCLSGGESWILGLNVLTGGRLDRAVFDVNGDRVFDLKDKVACGGSSTCDASGFKLNDGSLDSPGSIFGDGFDSLYNSGLGDGGIEQNTAAGSGGEPGRMSWRQVQ